MSVNQADCKALIQSVPENIWYWLWDWNQNFINLHLVSLKNMERAKVGQSLPLRGVPVSGRVSNTLRGLIVRLKSSLFLVQVYGTANETLLIIPESSYSYLRSTRITSGYPVGVLSVSLILIKLYCVSWKMSPGLCHQKCFFAKIGTKNGQNRNQGQWQWWVWKVTYSSELRGQIHSTVSVLTTFWSVNY